MNNEKKIIIVLSIVAICALGAYLYTYLLSSDLEYANQKIAQLEQSIAKNTQQTPQVQGGSSKFRITWSCKKISKKIELTEEEYNKEIDKMKRIGREAKEATKLKTISEEVCTPTRYCDIANILSNISFGKKDFATAIQGTEPIKGTYSFDKNSIFLTPAKNTQQELAIRAWDDKNNIIEFLMDGKIYNSTACKSPEMEQEERKKILAEEYNKEASEKEKIEQERLEKEKIAQERIENKKREEERLEREREEKEKLQEIVLKMQKLEYEKLKKEQNEKNRIEKEKLDKEKFEQEQLKKVKPKIKSF